MYKEIEKKLDNSALKLKGARSKRLDKKIHALFLQKSWEPNKNESSLDWSYPFINRQSLDISSISNSIECTNNSELNKYYSLVPLSSKREASNYKAVSFLPSLANNENSIQNLTNQVFWEGPRDLKVQTNDLKSQRIKLKEEATQNIK